MHQTQFSQKKSHTEGFPKSGHILYASSTCRYIFAVTNSRSEIIGQLTSIQVDSAFLMSHCDTGSDSVED